MRRKRSRLRQYVYHCLACLIILLAPACARLRQGPGPAEEERCLPAQHAQVRIEHGDFDGAVRVYQTALARPTREIPADTALFSLGLLYAHYANPKKDYKKSLAYFTRLAREHPRSPLAEEARTWSDLIEAMEKAKRVDIELEQKLRAMER